MPSKTVFIVGEWVKKDLADSGVFLSDEAMVKAAYKVKHGLGIYIPVGKQVGAPAHSKFFKLKLTTKGAAVRSVFWVRTQTGRTFLILGRPKGDKKIGTNMSTSNKHFIEALRKGLKKTEEDLENGHVQVFEIES